MFARRFRVIEGGKKASKRRFDGAGVVIAAGIAAVAVLLVAQSAARMDVHPLHQRAAYAIGRLLHIPSIHRSLIYPEEAPTGASAPFGTLTV